MRIPSQFNQDSLYRRDNRQRETGDGYRRLIRLVIGLALVIVVMRQASRPAMYQTFFDPSVVTNIAAQQGGDLSSPPPGAFAIAGVNQDNAAERDAASSQPDPISSTPEDRMIAKALAEQLLPTDQRQWVVGLARWQTGQPVQSIPSSIESISSQLASMEGISQTLRNDWQHMLESFSTTTSLAVDDLPPDSNSLEADRSDTSKRYPVPSERDRPRVAALLTALDDAASARVVDGSVWRAGDFDSLYRLLNQAQQPPRADVAATGVIPLLQQPDVFRNQWVKISGAVARTERIESPENPFGIDHYWQLWLRPSDGADRPMVAIVPAIPDSVAAVGSESTKMEGPEIVVVGRFLKRLAYQSRLGADLAPVVVGQITSAPISEAELQQLKDSTRSDTATPMWLPILAACLIGIAGAVLVMWRTAVSAKRARALRASHRDDPDSFLLDLSHSEPDQSITGENQ